MRNVFVAVVTTVDPASPLVGEVLDDVAAVVADGVVLSQRGGAAMQKVLDESR